MLVAFLMAVAAALAQMATLRGTVSDESGAVVPGAKVTLTGQSPIAAVTANDGTYLFSNLPPGACQVQVSAPDLALSAPVKLVLKAGPNVLNLQLKVAAISQQVTVIDTAGSTVTPEPSNNASALVLRGAELDALADDPTDLASDLQALAGPSAGPNGGAIFIDGFSGGQIPSKDSIREIRVNQNPFSPEYDKLGLGRIEIFTKPGSDRFRGTAFYNFADDFWNSRNPYAAQKAPFLLKEYGGNLGGPVGRRSSFFLDVRRDATDNGAIINGVTLDPVTQAPARFDDVYNVQQRSIRVSPRFDTQLNTNNTLTFRYAFSDMDIPGAGIGSFSLPSRGYDAKQRAHTIQLSETAVFGTTINEVRFQYFRVKAEDIPFTAGPAISVLGAFNDGGSTVGNAASTGSNYELQEYVSHSRGAHSLKFGARFRREVQDSFSPQNYNGTFTFGGGAGLSSIDLYRLGRPTQFSIAAGDPSLALGQFDLGAFVNDDWRVKSNLTLSLGLRYEIQTNIHDHRDFAPRLGLAWAPRSGLKGAKAKTVLRAGFGMFYDRFALANSITAQRYNGLRQRQYIIANPDFYPAVPPVSQLPAASSVIERVAPDLRAPYILQSAIGLDQQLWPNTTIAVTYANSRGVHMLRSTVVPAAQTTYLMESSGIYNQNQLIVNLNARINANISLIGAYSLNRAMSDTDGLGTFPANPRSYAGEYGPSATDVRNRASLGGSLNMRWNVRLSPFIVLESGPPFDITAGRDVYGTTLFNARPGIATNPSRLGVIATAYGLLDPNPTPDEAILPRNCGRGPGSVLVNLRLAKTIGFGHSKEANAESTGNISGPPGGGSRGPASPFGGGGMSGLFAATPSPKPYNLTISMSVRNIINHNNPGAIVGNITSPLFGQANQPAGAREAGGGGFSESANNRRLELQVRFTF